VSAASTELATLASEIGANGGVAPDAVEGIVTTLNAQSTALSSATAALNAAVTAAEPPAPAPAA
jgi:hypothetical protein